MRASIEIESYKTEYKLLTIMIAIIGAAHVGNYLAYLLAKEGFEVGVFEEHSNIGRPVHCTGIVTRSILDVVDLNKKVIVSNLNKARIYAPNNEFFDVKIRDLLLDRPKFEQFLADKAMKAGARFHLHHKCMGYENGEVVLKEGKEGKIKRVKSDIVIGADGPNSIVTKILNPNLKMDYYIGAQAVAKSNLEKGMFEVYLGNIAPEFFAWNVAESDGCVRIGLATKKMPHIYFERLLQSKNIKKEDIIEYQGGLIPIYNSKIKTHKGNVYIVGDAASMVKATTGGGIIQGILGAEALAESIKENKNYEQCWRKKLTKDLWLHFKMRKTLDKFSDEDYNFLIRLFSKEKIRKVLELHDRDYPSRFVLKLLFKEPRFLYFAKHIL